MNPAGTPTQFSLDFAFGRGFLSARQLTHPPVNVHALLLEVPDLRPSELTRQASHFSGTRCTAQLCAASASTADINRWLDQRLSQHDDIVSARVALDEHGLWLLATVHTFGRTTRLAGRLRLEHDGQLTDDGLGPRVTLRVDPPWVHGPLPAAAAPLLHRVLVRLLAGDGDLWSALDIAADGGAVDLPVLRTLLAGALAGSPWRLPATHALDHLLINAHEHGLELLATNTHQPRLLRLLPVPAPGGWSLLTPPSTPALCAAIAAVHAGQVDRAFVALSQLVTSDPGAAPWLVECAAATGEPGMVSAAVDACADDAALAVWSRHRLATEESTVPARLLQFCAEYGYRAVHELFEAPTVAEPAVTVAAPMPTPATLISADSGDGRPQPAGASAEPGQADALCQAAVSAYFDDEDDDRAMDLLESALALDPTVLERHFDALGAWESLCRARQRPDAMLTVFDIRIRQAGDPALEGVHRLLKAEYLLQELRDGEGALAVVGGVLQRDPVHVPALQLRAEILAQMGRDSEAWETLKVLLRPSVTDDVERVGVLLLAARFATRTGQPEAADVWWLILRDQPAHTEALAALRALAGEDAAALWLVIEHELSVILGCPSSDVGSRIQSLDWETLTDDMAAHVQSLVGQLMELRLHHQHRLGWPWRPLMQTLADAPTPDADAWETAALLCASIGWHDQSRAFWEGVVAMTLDPTQSARARRQLQPEPVAAPPLAPAAASEQANQHESEAPPAPEVTPGPAAQPDSEPQPTVAPEFTPPGALQARALAASIPSARATSASAPVPAVDLSDTFLTTLRDLERRRTSNPDQALRTLEDALRQTRVPAERCELLIRKARWLLAEDRAADALQPLKGAFIYQPANPELRYLMARASHALDQPAEAIRHARAANAYVHLLSDEAGRWIRELLEE